MNAIVISGTGLFTPTESISNEELVASFNAYVANYNKKHVKEIQAGTVDPLAESSVAFIEKASGIQSRYVMEKSGILDPEFMCPRIPERHNEEQSIQCEMSVKAAKGAMEMANKSANEIDAVFVACSNFQRPYPAIAIEVQNALGIEGFAVDMNMACSTATFGIQTAVDSIFRNNARSILMVNPEICSGHLNFRDRDSHFIFGDVCTAVIIEKGELCETPTAFEIVSTKLKTSFSSNIRNNRGFMNRTHPKTMNSPDKLFKQQGRKVFKEVVPMAAKLIVEHLAENNVDPSHLKRLWLHQANLSMNLLISKKVLGRDAKPEEAPVILNEYANTSSAGSIISFHKHNGDFVEGDLGIICSFGAGYSIGNVIVKKINL